MQDILWSDELCEAAFRRVAGQHIYEINFTTMDHGHQYRIRTTSDIDAVVQELKDEAESYNDFAFDFSTQIVSMFPQQDVTRGGYE